MNLMTAFLAALFVVLLASEATGLTCEPKLVDCSSNGFTQDSCPINAEPGCIVAGGSVKIKYSISDCTEHESFWIYSDNIVVHHGCRAKFEIVFQEGYSMGICECKGDPHCTTFDGVYWHYQGDCEYLMTRDNCGEFYDANGGPSPTFQVYARFWDRNGASDRVTWVKSVTILLDNPANTNITIDQGPELIVNGVTRLVPYPTTGNLPYYVYQYGRFMVVVVESLGLIVEFDGYRHLRIKLSSQYTDNTCGLCGIFNDDTADDFTQGPACANGNLPLPGTVICLAKSISTYIENKHMSYVLYNCSFEATNSEDFANTWANTDECCDTTAPPECSGSDLAAAKAVCEDIYVSPYAVGFENCMNSMTAQQIEFELANCILDICNNDPKCAVVLDIFASCCALGAPVVAGDLFDECAPQCGPNQYFSVCNPPVIITCVHFLQGTIPEPDEDALISAGCFCEDNYYLDGSGNCVSSDICGCLDGEEYLETHVMEWTVTMAFALTACQNRVLTIITVIVILDIQETTVMKMCTPCAYVKEIRTAIRLTILTCDGIGLKVKWNGDRTVKVELKASEYVNDTCGLCGVLNGYKPDDFTMGPACESTEGAITTDQNEFGDSWETSGDPECCGTVPPPPCTDTAIIDECGNLFYSSNNVFSECLSSFDALTVQFEYEACIEDICLGGDVLCDIIISLVEACCDSGFLIEDWGQWNYCKPVCGVNMNLEINEPTYALTCLEFLYGVTSDLILCTVDCHCLEGYYYDETTDTCVLDCGCLYTMPDGTVVVVPDGTVIITDPCVTYIVCHANSWVPYNPNCDDDVTCEVVDDVFTWECPENTVDVYSNCMDCKDPCSEQTCSGHGTCVVNDDCSYTCICEDCWFGSHCEIGPCTGVDCGVNQVCVPHVTADCEPSYTCGCEPDPCSGQTCSGHGTCVVNDDCSYTCVCVDCWFGSHCEIGPCTGVDCGVNQVCVPHVTADCEPSYTCGCEPDPCSGQTCSGHGTCVVNDDCTYTCVCVDCWFGSHCEIGPCTGVDCGVNQVCVPHVTADCEPSYTCGCEPDPCSGQTCSGHGTCVVNDDCTYTCVCVDCWFGSHCEIGPCTGVDCGVNQVCVPHVTADCEPSYTCGCEPDPCSGQTCSGHGTCVVNDDCTYTCVCVDCWFGSHCEIGPCTGVDCGVNQVCVPHVTADCEPSYTCGCEPDPCSGQTCSGHGTCVVNDDCTYTCVCVDCWFGSHCEIGPCTGVDCGVNQVCVPHVTADCEPSYTCGCEPDPCSGQTCSGHGTCVVNDDCTYTCVCVDCWFGSHCEIGPCTGVDCGVNQVCVPHVTADCEPSYTCGCEPDPCSGQTCSGHGTCVVNDDCSYTCVCVDCWFGSHCEIEMCSPGQYSTNGSAPCEDCPGCTYQDQCGETFCKDCAVNTYSAPGSDEEADCISPCTGVDCGVSQVCVPHVTADCEPSYTCGCEPDPCSGQTCSGHGTCVVNDDCSYTCVCVDCWFGSHCEIEMCSPGQYSTNGSAPCEDCPGCTYQDQCGETFCKDCAVNTYSAPGSDEEADCISPCTGVDCGVSQVCVPHVTADCEPSYTCGCEPDPCSGQTCSGHGTCVVNDDCSYTCVCVDCWFGSHCEIEMCPSGQYSEDGTCENCPGGTYQDECGQTTCKPCPDGETSFIGSDSIYDCFNCADEYGGGWKTLNVTISPSCYFFCGKEKNFAKAEARCEKKGGKMVTIETEAEDNMIYEEIKDGDHHWTGLQIIHEPPSPTFYWYAYPDREVTYLNIMFQYDNHRFNEDCVQIRADTGYWTDVPCRKAYKCICEIPMEAP
ncbi:hypothetical protein ScPMuIL_005371 [Solemya velum]